MASIYQPVVIEREKEIIEVLRETDFFIEYEIEDQSFAMTYLCDKLTDKFISGELGESIEEIFHEDDMEQFLKEIVAGSLLYDMRAKGILDSIHDENNEERFFLTEKGKEMAKNLGENLDDEK